MVSYHTAGKIYASLRDPPPGCPSLSPFISSSSFSSFVLFLLLINSSSSPSFLLSSLFTFPLLLPPSSLYLFYSSSFSSWGVWLFWSSFDLFLIVSSPRSACGWTLLTTISHNLPAQGMFRLQSELLSSYRLQNRCERTEGTISHSL